MIAFRRKLFIIVVMITMVFGLFSNSFAFADADNLMEGDSIDTIEVNRVSDAEELLEKYFEEIGYNIEIGTPDYVEYLTDLLIFEEDEDLKKLSQYENIKIYASEYLTSLNDSGLSEIKGNKVLLNEREECKSIAAIKKEAAEEAILEDVESNVLGMLPDIKAKAAKGYSASDAVKYARTWARWRNPLYNTHRYDCTNFVSQCVKAGGKSMTKPSPIPAGLNETSKYWYSVRYLDGAGNANEPRYKWRESSSFTVVGDFYSYWKSKGITTKSYSSKTKLQNGAKIGEVVQLKNGDGKWFHSIIITGGNKGDRTYCGHSSNRKDYPVKKISDAVSYRGLKF